MAEAVPAFARGWVEGDTLTAGQARQVREWRVDDEYTWRGVAYQADEEWGLGTGGNQQAGYALCWIAATVLGEDPKADPWN